MTAFVSVTGINARAYKSVLYVPSRAQSGFDVRTVMRIDVHGVIGFFAPRSLDKLALALIGIVSSDKLQGTYKKFRTQLPPAARTYSFLYALKSPCEWMPLELSAGKMCAESCGITPPCMPIVIAGELISERAVQILKSGKNTFGLMDGKIKVVKR